MLLIDRAVALSTRQEAFCRHFTVSGYAERSARQTGSALLERPWIVERVRRIRMSWKRTERGEACWPRKGPFDPDEPDDTDWPDGFDDGDFLPDHDKT